MRLLPCLIGCALSYYLWEIDPLSHLLMPTGTEVFSRWRDDGFDWSSFLRILTRFDPLDTNSNSIIHNRF